MGQVRVAVAKAAGRVLADDFLSAQVEAAHARDHVGELAQVGAGVHDQTAPHAAGYAAEKLQSPEGPLRGASKQSARACSGLNVDAPGAEFRRGAAEAAGRIDISGPIQARARGFELEAQRGEVDLATYTTSLGAGVSARFSPSIAAEPLR